LAQANLTTSSFSARADAPRWAASAGRPGRKTARDLQQLVSEAFFVSEDAAGVRLSQLGYFA
jgi:hypothetical protein